MMENSLLDAKKIVLECILGFDVLIMGPFYQIDAFPCLEIYKHLAEMEY